MSDTPEKYTLTKGQRFYNVIKRCLDVVLSLLALILLSPVFLGIYLAIKIEDGWKANAIFDQTRIGVNQKKFALYKFRSMKIDTPHDVATHLLEHPEQYVTKVGRFIRKTSLDELPQLINIIKGDMSISGPRPALWNQFDLIELREQFGIHQLRPGLTGWAQINGRDELEIPEKVRRDYYYLRHFGLWMDIRCFFKSIGAVLSAKGFSK